ncbi:hypothetical protein SBBP1_30001 [Burkholderiales bacterium]|nr:hypothetical protein SBBP1_30001 [Burkholderiales bacterium]
MITSILGRLATHTPQLGILVVLPQMLTMTSLAISSKMLTLARFRHGRILLHLIAMVGDRSVRFHVAGIVRELPWVA